MIISCKNVCMIVVWDSLKIHMSMNAQNVKKNLMKVVYFVQLKNVLNAKILIQNL